MTAQSPSAGPGGAVAPVNRILPISTVDGPGARAVIFLQGCNISCGYCHNPETRRMCVHCGTCVAGCPTGALAQAGGHTLWSETLCTGCDQCIRVCPHSASPKTRLMNPEEAMAVVRGNLPFIRGITVSGGECTLYPEFLTGLFTLARAEGLSCLIDTNGTVDFTALPALVAACDGVMLDVKAWDPAVYRALTGANYTEIVNRNLVFLHQRSLLEELRVVCLPGHVDAEAVIGGIADILGDVSTLRLKLISFRPHGVRGPLAGTSSPDTAFMHRLKALAAQQGFGNIIVV